MITYNSLRAALNFNDFLLASSSSIQNRYTAKICSFLMVVVSTPLLWFQPWEDEVYNCHDAWLNQQIFGDSAVIAELKNFFFTLNNPPEEGQDRPLTTLEETHVSNIINGYPDRNHLSDKALSLLDPTPRPRRPF